MFQEELRFDEIIPMIQVFRVENNRWPLDAVELLIFSEGYGRNLDYSALHTLTFSEAQTWVLTVDYSVPLPGGELATMGQFEISRVAIADAEETFRWHVVFRHLTVERIKRMSYCLRSSNIK